MKDNSLSRFAAVLFVLLAFSALSFAGEEAAAASETAEINTSKLALRASATLTAEQASQPEVIFVYSFPLPPGQELFLGLKGLLSISSPKAVFNETLITVATNVAGACPTDGLTFPNYTALYAAYPNILPLQSFILKTPDQGTNKLAVDYTMPAGLPISDCAVVLLDWEGSSKVHIASDLQMSYTTDSTVPTGEILSTNQEFVYGVNLGPGSTTDDSLSFVQEAKVPQAGTLRALMGDISDSTFGGPLPPGKWSALNDIYLVRGGCPKAIHVNSGGWTPKAGHYYDDIPQDAVHLFNAPLSGFKAADAQRAVYKPLDVKVQKGDCLLTLFGLKAPDGGGIDSENQVQTLFVPSK